MSSISEFPMTSIIEDQNFRGVAAGILKYWIDIDNTNSQHVSRNNYRFYMTDSYATNAIPEGGSVILSLNTVDRKDLETAVYHLIEPLDGVSQHLLRNDLLAAVR
jgi:hypothetical protein